MGEIKTNFASTLTLRDWSAAARKTPPRWEELPLRGRIAHRISEAGDLEHFQAKCEAVCRRKCEKRKEAVVAA